MKYNIFISLFFTFILCNSQTINLNESFLNDYLRTSQLLGKVNSNISFNQRPFDISKRGVQFDKDIFDHENYARTIFNSSNEKINLKILPIDYNIELNTHHPYNRNNGSMIPNRGYQHIISAGLYAEIGPLSIQLKPEHLYAENKDFEGFGEGPNGHYPVIWAKRYNLWNFADIPERFGEKSHNLTIMGQSSIG